MVLKIALLFYFFETLRLSLKTLFVTYKVWKINFNINALNMLIYIDKFGSCYSEAITFQVSW